MAVEGYIESTTIVTFRCPIFFKVQKSKICLQENLISAFQIQAYHHTKYTTEQGIFLSFPKCIIFIK